MDTSLLYTLADDERQEKTIRRIQQRMLAPTGLLIGSESQPFTNIVTGENGPQKAKIVSASDDDEFATGFIFSNLGGGPVATRTPDLYRVKVAL